MENFLWLLKVFRLWRSTLCFRMYVHVVERVKRKLGDRNRDDCLMQSRDFLNISSNEERMMSLTGETSGCVLTQHQYQLVKQGKVN
jgi:hypothetical protein